MPLNKSVCHISHVCPTAWLLYSTYRPNIVIYINKLHNTIAIYVPATHMPLKCHMPKSFNVHQKGKYANIHAMYELTDYAVDAAQLH